MNLSEKHSGQKLISRNNFSGLLNTTSLPELIGDNQLAECINMELDKATGRLKTCCGSVMIYKTPSDVTISSVFYDKINNVFLVIDSNKIVYKSRFYDMKGTDGDGLVEIGELSGDLSPVSVMWEDGLLIASGGRLQYWNGLEFVTIQVNFTDEMNSYSWSVVVSSAWKSETLYEVDDIVVYNDTYYICTEEHTSGDEFDTDKFSACTIHDEFEYETAYTTTDIVTYSGEYYICKEEHTSLSDAPEICNGVFVKSGRVWVWHDYRLICSGTGDERFWTDDSNDDSSSKWLDVGYKEGEQNSAYIAGVTALSSDIIIIKFDGKIYRLTGDYPEWSLIELARNVYILNRNSYCAIQNSVLILSSNSLFMLETTNAYGDIEPQNVAVNVKGLLQDLSVDDTKMTYIPSLNQIWITMRGNEILVLDVNFKGFFLRQFNNRVVSIAGNYNDTVILARADKVTRLMDGVFSDEMFSDDETPIYWKVVMKSEMSLYDILLKRCRLSYVPLSTKFTSAYVKLANGRIQIPIVEGKHKDKYIINDDKTLIVNNTNTLIDISTETNTRWMVYRNRDLDISAEGNNAPVIINDLSFNAVEV